jgi:hypothetical protein
MVEVGPHGSLTAMQDRARTVAFDGCPACCDAAVEAIAHASLYLLASAAPSVLPAHGDVLSYRAALEMRLSDPQGRPLAHDRLEVEQRLSADVTGDEAAAAGHEEPLPQTGMPAHRDPHVPQAQEFQVLVDRLELAAEGQGRAEMRGVIEGRLFACELLVGSLEIAIGSGR